MRVRVHIDQSGMKINEEFVGQTADEIVGKVKSRLVKELNFAMKIVVNAMSNLSFAQEIVKKVNEAKKQNLPLPTSCEEFFRLAQDQGYATLEED